MTMSDIIRRLELAAAEMLGGRVYVALASRLPEPWRSVGRRCLGLSGNALDLALQPYLQWQGRGPAILVGDEAISEYVAALAGGRPGANHGRLLRPEIAGVIAHELGHIVEQQWTFDALPGAAAAFVAAASSAWAEADHPPAVETPVPWQDHGGPWLRLALHAAYRLAQPLGLHSPPSIETQPYGLSAGWRYAAALDDEPDRLAGLALAGLALADVAETSPPEAFRRLWQADVRRWFAALPDPSEAQVTALIAGLSVFPLSSLKENDMIGELMNKLRSRRETAHERVVSLARRAAAGDAPDVAELDGALREAGLAPEAFGDLARRCAERRRLADVAAEEPVLRSRLAELQGQIEKHDAKLQRAEEARDAAVWPLENESIEIAARLAQCGDAARRLGQVIIDSEADAERRRLAAERSASAAQIANLKADADAARQAAAGLERASHSPLDSRASRKASNAEGLKRRAEYIDGQVAELQERFDAMGAELEPLERRLQIV